MLIFLNWKLIDFTDKSIEKDWKVNLSKDITYLIITNLIKPDRIEPNMRKRPIMPKTPFVQGWLNGYK